MFYLHVVYMGKGEDYPTCSSSTCCTCGKLRRRRDTLA